jgi:NAD(P)-dependent dehydrogenase (short-subunit alcohol dehydrogenase family)
VLRPGILAGAGITLSGAVPAAVGARLRELGAGKGTDALVHAAAPPRDADGVRAALDEAWDAIRASGMPPGPRLIVLLAPPPGDAHHAAARAGLENLARTLSIEWAQHGIRPVAVLPGGDDEATAELVAYLASPAGAYFSGCAITLRPPTGPRPSPPSASPAPPRTPPAPSPSG